MDAPTHNELVAIARDEMLANNALLDPTVVELEGHPFHILVNVCAAMGSDVVRQLILAYRSQFLDTAEGEALSRLVYDRYALVRLGAAPSIGHVQFSRPTAAAGAVTLPSGTQLVSSGGVKFETTAPAIFGESALGPISVQVRSVLAGAGQRAAALAISGFQVPPADPSIVVSNPSATVGDDDGETDSGLRERARRFFENAQRGTLRAIEYAALSVPGVRFAVATEATTMAGEPARWVKLQVADRQGQSNSALLSMVTGALGDWRPAGIHVELIGATVTYVSIAVSLLVSTSFDAAAVAADVRAALVATLDGFAPGRTLYHADVIVACKGVAGVLNAQVHQPPTSLAPSSSEVLRTRLDLVSVSG